MTFCSLEFLLPLTALAAFFFWLPGLRTRQTVWCAISFGFLGMQVPDSATGCALGLLLLSGFLVARALQAFPSRVLLGGYLIALLAAFVVLKRYVFLGPLFESAWLGPTLAVVGLSYLVCRQVHLSIDAMQGQIELLSWWSYLNYQINLFTLLAGPIQRFQDFQQSWDRLEPLQSDWYDAARAYRRLFLGVIRIELIAEPCLWAYDSLLPGLTDGSLSFQAPTWKVLAKFIAVFYLFPFYIYFNFSGYCDIVIAAASLLGIKLPENFDRPWLARNMIDFWTRWHRTLGFWIRDYLFMPLYKCLAEHWPRRASLWAIASYFLAMLVAGLWHGSTWNFAVYGALNALGIVAAKLWENHLVRRGGRQGLRRYLQSPSIRVAAVAANFHFACLTLLFFPGDLTRASTILQNVTIAIRNWHA